MYLHERPDWPHFRWNSEALAALLAEARHKQGRLLGQMQALGFRLRGEATLLTLTEDVVQSSEIEGETLDRESVRSSIARRLGLHTGGLKAKDRNVEGMVGLTLDATRHFDQPLTAERLFGWHASLFPTGRSGLRSIRVGAWRNGPMQVVSGTAGRERVHYQAPPAAGLKKEMAEFLKWFNSGPEMDLVLKAGVAHFWFVMVHPFDDGNGRLARAISDLCLARSEQSSHRFYSLSAQIRSERKVYYEMLERAGKGGPEITPWLVWFLGCLGRAVEGSEALLTKVLAKSRFWESVGESPLNERQRAMLNRLLDGEFKGKLTSPRWAKMTKCSPDTALRDITDLLERGILERSTEGGRSTSYHLAPRRNAL